MNDIQLTYREYYLYFVVGAAVVGALLGIIPLVLARRRGKPGLGWIALVSSTIAGALLGPVASLIAVGIFIFVILRSTGAGSKHVDGSASE